MSTKSKTHRPKFGKRRAIVGGAFGKKFIRKGGKARHGYIEVPNL